LLNFPKGNIFNRVNLLWAGLIKDFEALNRSPWSGHSALAGNINREWQDSAYVLSFFGRPDRSVKNYLHYVKKDIEKDKRPELVGGGLIRSMGGNGS